MYIPGALVGGLRALGHLAHGYCTTGAGQAVSLVDTGTGGLCSMITSAIDSVVVKVEDSLSGFDNTTSGIFGHSVIGHGWVSEITTLFLPGTDKDAVSSMYDTSGDNFFVGDIPVSVSGRIVFGFTDLVLYTVSNDLVNDTIPATTTDLIVAPEFDLVLWEDAPACRVPERWFITKDIIAVPVFEIAVWPWVLPNAAPVWEDPRVGSWTTWLDSAPLPAEMASGSWAKNAAGQLSAVTRHLRQASTGTIGIWSVSLAIRALTVTFGLGLCLLVLGAMLWSTLTTSWYNTGLGNGISLAALEVAEFGLNYFSPARRAIHVQHRASLGPPSIVEDLSDPWEGILELYLDLPEEASLEAISISIPDVDEDLSDLSDEELEREILELQRKMDAQDAKMDMLESGIAQLEDNILVTLGDRGWESEE